MWVINATGPNGNFITHIITHIERWLWVVWGGQRRTAEVSAGQHKITYIQYVTASFWTTKEALRQPWTVQERASQYTRQELNLRPTDSKSGALSN